MKKLQILLIFVTLFLMKASIASAQVSVSFNINSQPLWGPVSYDYVEYYYLPEYDIYYDAPKAQFVYMKDNRWLFSGRLPYQYRNIDLYSTYKVVINEPKPYLRNDHYANHYKQYKHEHSKQELIRDSHDSKYTNRKNHPNKSQNMFIAPQKKKLILRTITVTTTIHPRKRVINRVEDKV
jgi:hypothetical protein